MQWTDALDVTGGIAVAVTVHVGCRLDRKRRSKLRQNDHQQKGSDREHFI